MLATRRAALVGARRAFKTKTSKGPAAAAAKGAGQGRDPFGLFKEALASPYERQPRQKKSAEDKAWRAEYSRQKMAEVCAS